jgi:hypothetical protein
MDNVELGLAQKASHLLYRHVHDDVALAMLPHVAKWPSHAGAKVC